MTVQRITNNRIAESIEMTQVYAGGRNGKFTTDHILIIERALARYHDKKPI